MPGKFTHRDGRVYFRGTFAEIESLSGFTTPDLTDDIAGKVPGRDGSGTLTFYGPNPNGITAAELEALQRELKTWSYKPGATIFATGSPWHEAMIRMVMDAPNTYNPEQTAQVTAGIRYRSQVPLPVQLHELVHLFESHEADEWLMRTTDGYRPYDPHAKPEDRIAP